MDSLTFIKQSSHLKIKEIIKELEQLQDPQLEAFLVTLRSIVR
jgi:hypothetical protein